MAFGAGAGAASFRDGVDEEPPSISPDELPSSAPPPHRKREAPRRSGKRRRYPHTFSPRGPRPGFRAPGCSSAQRGGQAGSSGQLPEAAPQPSAPNIPLSGEGRGRTPRAHLQKETQSTNARGDIQARAEKSEQEVQATRWAWGIPRARGGGRRARARLASLHLSLALSSCILMPGQMLQNMFESME